MSCPIPGWRDRVWREFRAGNLTRAYRDVLLTLATYRGPGGRCWPAHATLAERAGCSVRTVARALAMAARLGLVEWAERRVRASWRWLRTSNLYRLLTPAEPLRPGLRAPERRFRTNCQHGRGGEISKKKLLGEALRAASELPDLLAARRAVIAERMRATMGR